MWDDYKHLFASFSSDDSDTRESAGLPLRLDHVFKFKLHVSNVGAVTVIVPPLKDAATLSNVSNADLMRALACFTSPRYVIQLEGGPDGWILHAQPFRNGMPHVTLHADRDYTLLSCKIEENKKIRSAFFANDVD
jgi:hypothetical protein